jgi:hypothetical protein
MIAIFLTQSLAQTGGSPRNRQPVPSPPLTSLPSNLQPLLPIPRAHFQNLPDLLLRCHRHRIRSQPPIFEAILRQRIELISPHTHILQRPRQPQLLDYGSDDIACVGCVLRETSFFEDAFDGGFGPEKGEDCFLWGEDVRWVAGGGGVAGVEF